MSKEAKYVVEVERINSYALDKAIDQLICQLQAKRLFVKHFEIYTGRKIQVRGICVKLQECLYPVDIYVDEKQKLIINGDDMDIRRVGKRVKQFYEGTEFSLKFNTQMSYNKKTEEIDMLLEVS